jgi:hypothetical protein
VTAAVGASDDCGPAAVVLESITSSEPDDARGRGDGATKRDIQDAVFGTADFAFRLRAERDSLGPGRTYTVTYRATDETGNTSTTSAVVVVPRNMGGPRDRTPVTVPEAPPGSPEPDHAR